MIARLSGKLIFKQPPMLLIDVSASRDFGSFEKLKKNIITELSAVLSFSAIQNNDKIGVIFFSDKIEKFIPPKKGKSHILRIILPICFIYTRIFKDLW